VIRAWWLLKALRIGEEAISFIEERSL